MTIKDLIEALQEHNPEAEVHVSNDRGYYESICSVSCYDFKDVFDEETEEYVEGPQCDDSCRKNDPVILFVD